MAITALSTSFLRLLAGPVTVGFVVFALSFLSITFTRQTDSIAILWPANAVLLAALLRGKRDLGRHGLLLISASLAFYTSNAASGRSHLLSLAFTAADIAEVEVALILLIKTGYASSDISRPRNLFFFLLCAAAVAPLVSASLGAAAVSMALGQPFLQIWFTWYVACALGMAIVTPMAMSINSDQLHELRAQNRTHEAAIILVVIFLIACLTSYYRSLLFITSPLVLFATFRLGVFGAATATLIIAVVATIFLVTGAGPLVLAQSSMADRIVALQIFLATMVLWSLPVAAVFAERNRFAAQLSGDKERAESESAFKSRALKHLQQRLWKAEEDERLRLAHELHDRTGQQLAITMLELKQIEAAVTAEAIPHLNRLRTQLDEIGKTLHRVAWELRPAAIDELGLSKALAAYVTSWGEKFDIDAQFQCNDPDLDGRSNEVRTTLFRVTQEALTNVAKHAKGATAVSVSLNRSGRHLRLTIEDNGCGFDPNVTDPRTQSGLGLSGMHERLSLVAGELDIESTRNVGTTLFARLPLDPSGAIT
jgi:signal transduction histidine kinase